MISKKKLNYLSQLIVSFETYITKICFFISIASYVSFGNEISAKKVYMLLSYYDSIKSALFISFPLGEKSTEQQVINLIVFCLFVVLTFVHSDSVNHKCKSINQSDRKFLDARRKTRTG